MPLLEPIMKGLIEWIYEMVVSIMEYAANELVGVMRMDMTYFEKTAPVIKDITNIILALGWGLLIANMVFQSLKVMMSGAGFESEDPKHIFCRTFVFSFLLLASRQICNMAMGITGKVIELLRIPSELSLAIPDQSMFSIGSGAKWLIVIVVGFILIFQYIKLLFEIGERYVVTSVLTFFAPLAFAMGGSKNTNDIFKGWCRMYGSMMVMMIMNIVFLKMILSAMGNVTSGSVLIWLVFVIALTRVARKIDSHIGKIGLNPAQTGDGVGSRLPGMMTMVAVRTMASTIGRNISSNRDTGRRSSGGHRHTSYERNNTGGAGNSGGHTNTERTAASVAGRTGGSLSTVNMSTGGANTSSQQNTSQSQSSQSALNQNNQGASKTHKYGKYGLSNFETEERYNEFPNGNPAAHAARYAKPNPVNGINRETSSHTSDVSMGDTGTKSSPAGMKRRDRPPIARNPTVGVNGGGVNNIGGVNTEQSSSSVGGTTQIQTPSGGSSQTSISQGVSSNRSRSTSHSPGNIQNGSQTVNNAGGQTSSVVSTQKNTMSGGVNNNLHTDNMSRQQHVNNHRQINHEYKNGRYNPAAVNKKQDRTLYRKQMTIKKIDSTNEMRIRKKRGGDNGRTKK